MKPTVFFRPFSLKNTKRTLKVHGGTIVNLTKITRHTKVVNPNADLLAVMPDLFGASFEEAYGFPLEVEGKNRYGESISLAGLLRALLIFKYRYPELYGKLVKLSKLLSYEFNDEEVKVPPLHLLLNYPLPQVESVWKVVEAETGFTKELYALALYRSFRNISVGIKTLFDEVALLRSNPEDDDRAVKELVRNITPPAWFDETAAVLSSYKDRIEADYHTEGPTKEELKEAISQILQKLKEELKSVEGEE